MIETLAHAYLDAQIESALTPGTSPGDHAIAGIRAVLTRLREQAGDPEFLKEVTLKASALNADPWEQRDIAEIVLTVALDHILTEG